MKHAEKRSAHNVVSMEYWLLRDIEKKMKHATQIEKCFA